MAPHLIGPYQVVRELGRGGMGVVYEALDPVAGRRVALKVVHESALDPELLARFEREARLLARVNHPNVVKVHALERVGRSPVLVTELIEGARPLEAGPLPARSAAQLVRELARGVEAVHRAGVLHRDLKPANVVRRADGTVVLLDFGVARELDGSSLTRTGDLVGTPAFMAPEQVMGRRDVDARVDVYGLGALLYVLLVGAPPFEGGLVQLLAEVLERDPRWPRERAGTPDGLDAIVRRAMAKAPADRQPSAAALGDELDRWLAGPPEGRPAARRSTAIGVGAVVSATVVAGICWGFATRDDRPRAAPPDPPSLLPGATAPSSATPPGSAPARSDAELLDDRLSRARRGDRQRPLFDDTAPRWLRVEGQPLRATFLDARRLSVVVTDASSLATVQVTSEKLVWSELETPREVGRIRRAVACGERLAIAGTGGLVLFDPVTRVCERVVDTPVVDLVSAGSTLLYGDRQLVWVLNVGRGPPRQVADLGPSSMERKCELALSPDGSHAVVVRVDPGTGIDHDEALDLRIGSDPTAPVVTSALPGSPSGLTHKAVAVAADGRVAFGGDCLLLELTSRGGLAELEVKDRVGLPSLTLVTFAPRGGVIYAASSSRWKPNIVNEVVTWSPGGALRRVERPHPMSSLSVSPDGQLLAVGTYQGTLEVWAAGDE